MLVSMKMGNAAGVAKLCCSDIDGVHPSKDNNNDKKYW